VTELSVRGKRVRLAISTVVIGLLFFTTFWGHDEYFPFAPMRMFATANEPDGVVRWFSLQKQLNYGEWQGTALSPTNVGINRAELEGQIDRVIDNPDMLRMLADAHVRLDPDGAHWTGVRVIRNVQHLEDSVPVGEVVREVVVTWEKPR
jgi:hypothetical protein